MWVILLPVRSLCLHFWQSETALFVVGFSRLRLTRVWPSKLSPISNFSVAIFGHESSLRWSNHHHGGHYQNLAKLDPFSEFSSWQIVWLHLDNWAFQRSNREYYFATGLGWQRRESVWDYILPWLWGCLFVFVNCFKVSQVFWYWQCLQVSCQCCRFFRREAFLQRYTA